MDTVDPRLLQAGPSSPPTPTPVPTKLKLTIPSLKALRERADSTKGKPSPIIESPVSKRPPRPPKLKPLKEVLAIVISKIKKCVAFASASTALFCIEY
jgi:bromodomain-containing protein 7/9